MIENQPLSEWLVAQQGPLYSKVNFYSQVSQISLFFIVDWCGHLATSHLSTVDKPIDFNLR